MKKHPIGAGMIVFREIDNCLKILTLRCHDGKLDLPKGRLDPGETLLSCAVRETYEESGISEIIFYWGEKSISLRNLTFYMCLTEQDPVIRPNPIYGNLEHQSAEWMEPHKAYKELPDYLRPAVRWAVGELIF